MMSFPFRSTFGRSDVCSRREASLASTQGHGRRSSVSTKASVKGDFGEDSWVPSTSEAPLSWRFLNGVVSELVISVESSSLGWAKSALSREIASIYYFETSCICWSSHMRSSNSGVLAKLEGKFLSN